MRRILSILELILAMRFGTIKSPLLIVAAAATLLLLPLRAGHTQDWFSTGINLGAPKIRLAVSEFSPTSVDQALVSLTQEFNQVLWNDLDNAGIFELVSKSYYSLKTPTEPGDVDFKSWGDPPAAAQMLV